MRNLFLNASMYDPWQNVSKYIIIKESFLDRETSIVLCLLGVYKRANGFIPRT